MALCSPVVVKLVCLAVIAMLVVAAAPSAEAISCGQVSSSLSPCINYLSGAAGSVPASCCSGIKSLNGAAKTPVDRQTACLCLKSVIGSIPVINLGLAAGLPGKCGVSVPYKISLSTNCNSVQ